MRGTVALETTHTGLLQSSELFKRVRLVSLSEWFGERSDVLSGRTHPPECAPRSQPLAKTKSSNRCNLGETRYIQPGQIHLTKYLETSFIMTRLLADDLSIHV